MMLFLAPSLNAAFDTLIASDSAQMASAFLSWTARACSSGSLATGSSSSLEGSRGRSTGEAEVPDAAEETCWRREAMRAS